MNRRQFTQHLAAVASAQLLPTSLNAKTIAAPVATQSQHHLWATFVARIHDKASPQMFKRQLSLTDAQAESVFRDLIKDKVLSTPNAQGVSHAMNPFKRNFATGLASSPQAAFQQKPQRALKERVKKLLETKTDADSKQIADDSDSVNPDIPKCQDESDSRNTPEPTNPTDSV